MRPSRRCKKKSCKKYVQPHDFHPVFTATGRGPEKATLRDQAASLFCFLGRISQKQARLLLGRNHKLYERVSVSAAEFLCDEVEEREKSIEFGAEDAWPDVEADEVDLRKGTVPAAEAEDPERPVVWEQWGGVVERGRPETLVLHRLRAPQTKLRSPGPGAIRLADWEPFARRRLEGRNIVLHTDGAKAYKLKVPGVLHDHVVHAKKMKVVNGQRVWTKPTFTRVFVHKLPDGPRLTVRGGTQVIDRAWRHVRSFLEGSSGQVGSRSLRRRVRFAQWCYWHRDKDLWLEMGRTLRETR